MEEEEEESDRASSDGLGSDSEDSDKDEMDVDSDSSREGGPSHNPPSTVLNRLTFNLTSHRSKSLRPPRPSSSI